MKLENCINKVCCFYTSDWHLTVMLLPYINKNVEESKIYMKFEESIEDKFKILLDKLELKNKNKLEHLAWNSSVQEEEYCDKEKIFIVSGNEEYINENNRNIENYYKNRSDKIKIINCYEITEKANLREIIKKNNYINLLNTKGEIPINKII